ncbi:MAG: hypothetical protein U1F25_04305 [Rubrivivax sp.]
MELPAGCNTKPGHWHSHEEEHLYAISRSSGAAPWEGLHNAPSSTSLRQ